MAKLYYRCMADQNGRSKIGRSSRRLGVRPKVDIDVEQMPSGCIDERGYLRPAAEHNDEENTVAVAIKNAKRMSVSLSIPGAYCNGMDI